jgi:hypothetical protein
MEAKCMREEALVDFLEGRLSERQRRRIERHLADCDACLEELGTVLRAEKDEACAGMKDVPAAVTERAVRAVHSLKRGSFVKMVQGALGPWVSKWSWLVEGLFPPGEPGLAPVRGSREDLDQDLILLRKAFSDLEADIELERRGGQRVSIKVRLTRDDYPERPVRATLLRGGEEMASMILGDLPAHFEDIPLGRYLLAFTRDGRRVGEYAFQVREMTDGRE